MGGILPRRGVGLCGGGRAVEAAIISATVRWRMRTTTLHELGWHDDRGNLLRFLDDPSMTNNRAERALRPAVIARKVSHCSKNDGGADAAFTSVIRTLARNGDRSVVDRAGLQRRSSPLSFPLYLSTDSPPLINYQPVASVRTALRG